MSNTPDQESVINRDDNTLVCALPGSGKTYTLVELTANLLRKDSKYSVLLITFTDAARQELQERLRAKLVRKELDRCEISTFHSIALRMVKDVLGRQLIMGPKLSLFTRRVLEEAKFKGVNTLDLSDFDAMGLFEKMGRSAEAIDKYSSAEQTLYALYRDMLEHEKLVDFSIICSLCVSWLSQEKIKPLTYSHILADEFQDTDEVQYLWLYEHGVRGTKLFVVGDDDQAIYSFRGGQGYDNMVRFQQDFSAEAFVLRDCFRCGKSILKHAENLINFNEDRIEKPMNATRDENGIVKVVAAGEKELEINQLIDAVAKEPHTWAVIARTNFSLDDVEAALRMYGVPYRRLGGKSIFDNPAAYGFVQLLQMLAGTHDPQTVKQALGVLRINQDSITRIANLVKRKDVSFGSLLASDLQEDRGLQVAHNLADHWEDVSLKAQKQDFISSALSILKDIFSKRDHAIAQVVADMLLNRDKMTLNQSILSLADRMEDTRKPKKDGEEPKLTLTTMHSSKGLQFQNVWIFRTEADVIPSPDSVSEGLVQEERRLMYVAMTRAMDSLFISFRSNPSEFISEIDPEFFEDWIEQRQMERKRKSTKDDADAA